MLRKVSTTAKTEGSTAKPRLPCSMLSTASVHDRMTPAAIASTWALTAYIKQA